MKQKVVVIGGGIAGLSAGVYALRCGFDVTVLESHSMAGGNCTSWKRKGYLFEGGMHWLTGSDKKLSINKLWRCIGALDDSVTIHCPEPYIEYNHNGTRVCLYRNVDTTEKHLIALSPTDEKEIRSLCNNIRKVRNLSMPVFDLRGVKTTKKQHPPLSLLFSGLSAMRLMRSFSKISRESYVNRFSHEGIRHLLRSVTEEKSGVVPLFFSMGIISSGDGGFPEGGSLPFVGRIVDRFKSLGGTLLLDTRAERVILQEGRAVGVATAGGTQLPAEAVIVASDTMLIDSLFEAQLHSPWLDKMREVTEPTMSTFLSLGVDADLRNYPKSLVLKPHQTITLGAQTYEYLSVNNYARDPAYSPEGKSALTIILGGDTYDFWRQSKEDGRYADEKQKIADRVIAALAGKMPEVADKVEVCDVATPLTYERYCGNWKGSWMTEMTPSMKMKSYPAVVSGLSGVYFAGQRMLPPGGLPGALASGRTAVQHLCRDTDTVFVSEE